MKKILVVVLLLLSPLVAPAQITDVFVTTGISASPQMGYGLGWKFGAAIESTSRHSLIIGSLNFNTANKVGTGDGFRVSSGGEVYLRRKALLIGAGGSWMNLYTSRYSKSSLHPSIGMGFEKGRMRILGAWALSGSDGSNGARGLGTQLSLGISERLRLDYTFAVTSFYPSNHPERARQLASGVGFAVTYKLARVGGKNTHYSSQNRAAR